MRTDNTKRREKPAFSAFINRSIRVSAALVCMLALSGCNRDGFSSLYDPAEPNTIDNPLNLTRKDYVNLTRAAKDPNIGMGAEDGSPPIPELAPILTAPQPPKLGQTKLVSLAVTDDVPLKDVLLELARLADVDIEVDASITGGIAFRAKDRPFNEVIERVADLAGLRYKMKDGVLRVERDTPYVEIYPIDFINIERSTTSSVNISTNVLSGSAGSTGSGSSNNSFSNNNSGGAGGGNGGLNTGSQSSITSRSDSDFWKQFEESVKQILQYKPAAMVNASTVVSVAPTAPDAIPPAPRPSAAAPASGSDKTFYILNRQGATLTISGTEKQHELIKRFIKKMEATASAQVLIEAKIVEVALNQEFQSGIDWNKLGGSKISMVTGFGAVSDPGNIATFAAKTNDFTGLNIDLDFAVRLAETFGTTRTLSSPRLHAINNQQAVLTFAENQVYFQVSVEREQNTSTVTNNTLLTVNSEIKTVPIGIILMIQPSINSETNEVTLNVRPTLSRITGAVSDPAVAFLVSQAAATGSTLDIDNRVPVVEVRELDSILKLKSGQVMVIGGLMEDKGINEDKGLPYVSEAPIIGNLFKGVNREQTTKELVIFIRATILDSNGYAQKADKAIYKKFTDDPRPLEF